MSTKGKTIMEQYRIIAGGRPMSECDVHSWVFPDESAAIAFHYAVMNARLDYEVFDLYGKSVNVVTFRNGEAFEEIAKELGGEKRLPKLK